MPAQSSRRPTRLVAAVGASALAALLTTTGCGVGFDAQTNFQGPPGNGAAAEAGPLAARGLLLVMDERGGASLIGTIVNLGADADSLTSVEVAGGSSALTLGTTPTTQVALPAHTSLQFGYGERAIVVRGLPAELGRFVDVTLVYGKAGRSTVPVLTVPPTGRYDGLGPPSA